MSKLEFSWLLRSNNRVLPLRDLFGPKEYAVKAGVPQESLFRRLLWNIMYDKVLDLHMPKEATFIGFVDDLAGMVVANYFEDDVTA